MLIATLFGFWPAIFLAYKSYHPNLWIVVCMSYWPFARSLSFRECSQLYLCNEDAETAHLSKILWLYAAEMQKMRIFEDTILSVFLPIGWMGGGRIHTFL